ncbi:MAG: lytic transglycosylase domain-containing protein [Reyranellaceae bacterium]
MMVRSRSCYWGAVAATARWWGAAVGVAFVLLCAVGPARAEPPGGRATAPRPSVDAICQALVQAAAGNDLPVEFFIRLIWQESHFNPSAVSPMGAQGIAQFMPATAAMRGLTNAFEPLQALRESASYLRELRVTFGGNLGLAAAAYNAGPGAVTAWRAGRAALPFETQAYVRLVTGFTVEAWTARQMPEMTSPPPLVDTLIGARCVELANGVVNHAVPRRDYTADPAWGPWGVQLAGSFSEGDVLARFERVRRRYEAVLGDHLPLVVPGRLTDASTYVVRVSAKSRADADALCARLRAAGGACIVLSNPRG